MSIKNFEKDGQIFYEVSVSRRSKIDPTIRIERRFTDIKSERDAHRIERRLAEEVQKEISKREQRGISWGRLVDEWELAMRNGHRLQRPVGATTATDYIASLRQYTPHWMTRPASEVTKADVLDVISFLTEEGRSNSRKRNVLIAINRAFAWGIDNGFLRGITASPATGIQVSREEERKPEILNLNEIRKLLEFARSYNHPWYPVWAAALLTGLRSGELFALQWSDVDWENKKVIVSKSYNGRLKVIKSTKAGYWREVPINTELELLLKDLRAKAIDAQFVLPRFQEWERGEAARVLRAFCEGIGISSIRFHTLRACFATQLLKADTAAVVVMKVCGWKDLKTMQRYIRLAGVEIDGATDRLKFITPQESVAKVVDLFRPIDR